MSKYRIHSTNIGVMSSNSEYLEVFYWWLCCAWQRGRCVAAMGWKFWRRGVDLAINFTPIGAEVQALGVGPQTLNSLRRVKFGVALCTIGSLSYTQLIWPSSEKSPVPIQEPPNLKICFKNRCVLAPVRPA